MFGSLCLVFGVLLLLKAKLHPEVNFAGTKVWIWTL